MNVLLQERRGAYVPLDFAEYMRWVSLWLARCCELTTKETFEDVEDPIPFNSRRGYSRYMSHKRFQDILACHTFRRGTPPDHDAGNRYWPIDSFWEAYNQNLAETVIPSWRLTIDESMNQWRGKKYDDGMPGVRNIPAKPKYKTLADSVTQIILRLDLARDKNAAPQEFNDQGKVIGGMLRLVKPWMGEPRTVYADSYFGSPASAVALMEKGLFSVMHVKKRRYFPKGVPIDIISSLPNDLGSYIARTANVPRKPHIKLLLVSQMDRKPQCVISTGGTTIQKSEVSRSEYLAGGARVVKQFKPIQVLQEYASAKGAVDVNNNVRDNKRNFHDVMRSANWQVRVLAFALAIAESNAYLAYRAYIHDKPNTRPSHMKYRHEIVTSLLTEEYASDEIKHMIHKEDSVPVADVHRIYTPEAIRKPAPRGSVGTPAKRYNQRQCVGKVHQGSSKKPRIRTYCICDDRAYCADCFADHVAGIEQ